MTRARTTLLCSLLAAIAAFVALPAADAKLPKEPGRNARNHIAAMDRVLDREIKKLGSNAPVDTAELGKAIKHLRDLKDNELMRYDLPAIYGVNFTILFHAVWFADRNLVAAQVDVAPSSGSSDSDARQRAGEHLAKAKKWLKRLHEDLQPQGGTDENLKALDPLGKLEEVIKGIDRVRKQLDELTPAEADAQISALASAKRALLNSEFPKLFGVPLGGMLFDFETIDDALLDAQAVVKGGNETAIKQSGMFWLDNARKAKLELEKKLGIGCGYLPDPKSRASSCGPPPLHPPFASTLAVSVAGPGSGAVAVQPSGVSCASPCTVSLLTGLQVTLVATGNPGSGFAQWSGACAGQGATCRITLVGPASATATFALTG